jgi:hypothetical protein
MLFRVRRDPLVYAAALIRPRIMAENYLRRPDQADVLSADGLLMRANKDLAQPGLKYFT